MASAAVTLGTQSHNFEVDTSEQTATVNHEGGWLVNTHATEPAFVRFSAASVTTTQPAGTDHACLRPGVPYPIPPQCRAFRFKAAAQTFLQYSPYALK